MNRHPPIFSTLWQALFGLLLVGWPLLDTGPMGAVTPLRIGLGSGLLLLITGAWVVGGREVTSDRMGNTTDRVILVGLVWYVGHVIFGEEGGGPVDPYNLLISYVFGAAYLFCRQVGTGLVLPAMVLSGLLQAGVATAQLGGLTATRNMYYDLTGSFPNPGPLGGWLCVALLAAVLLTGQSWENGRKTRAALLGGGLIGIILWLTDSRAAWVGLVAGLFSILLTRRFRYKKTLLGVSTLILAAGLLALYRYKKESADGRLLIWRVSADVIARRPVSGQGVGSFPERYMEAQGDYFARNPESRFSSVADQVSTPFNEWIGLVCEQGLLGGALALLLLGTALRRRGMTPEARHGQALLVAWTVFGLFSYPSAFLSFGLLLGAILARCADRPAVSERPIRWGSGVSVALWVAVAGGWTLWTIERAGTTDRSRYIRLKEVSARMRDFSPSDLPWLDRQAGRLPVAEFYTALGDRFLAADRTERAKHYYRQASRMIPSRLRPYDGLFRAYLRTGQVDSAGMMARKIVAMPVKVSNTTTIRIRHSVTEWLLEQQKE